MTWPLDPTAVKTSAYTAAAGNFVPVNASSASVTITLPSPAADGAQVGVQAVALSSGNQVTVMAGGSDTFDLPGTPSLFDIANINDGALLQYDLSTQVWSWNELAASFAFGELAVLREAPLNVKDPLFGAMGDGTTPDGAAIVSAITYAETSINGPGEVFLPPGTYLMDSAGSMPGGPMAITYNAPIVISGAGWSTTLRWRVDRGAGKYAIEPTLAPSGYDSVLTPEAVTIRDLWLIGHGGTGEPTIGVQPAQMDGLRLERWWQAINVRVDGFRSGFQLYGNHQQLHRCMARNNMFNLEFPDIATTDPFYGTSDQYGHQRIIGCTLMYAARANVRVGNYNGMQNVTIRDGELGYAPVNMFRDDFANIPLALTANLSTGAPITTLPVTAPSCGLPDGAPVILTSGANTQTWTLTTAAVPYAPSLAVASQTPNYAYPMTGTTVVGSTPAGGVFAQDCTFASLNWEQVGNAQILCMAGNVNADVLNGCNFGGSNDLSRGTPGPDPSAPSRAYQTDFNDPSLPSDYAFRVGALNNCIMLPSALPWCNPGEAGIVTAQSISGCKWFGADEMIDSLASPGGNAEPAYEVDVLAFTGPPTNGSTVLSFSWNSNVYTTAASGPNLIGYNATAGDVQSAILAATRSGVTAFSADAGAGAVVCTGGPLPATAVTIMFAGGAVGQVTKQGHTDSFLPSSSAASFTRSTWGNYMSLAYELDMLAITGSPTGGSTVLSFSWNGNVYTTAAIAYNALATAVQSAILAATRSGPIAFSADAGPGAVVCTGGPLPGVPVTIMFSGGAVGPVTQQMHTDSFTGGTSPAASFTRSAWGNIPPAYDVDVLAFAGSPTGGSTVLSFSWNGNVYTTAAIAYNALATAVQSAILAATRSGPIAFSADAGPGAVVCTGGPLPGVPVTIMFSGGAVGPVTQQMHTDSFTGGTSPAASFTASAWPTYEVDLLAITGSPTGGSTVLSFSWNGNVYTTPATGPDVILWNATATEVQVAILAATRSGPAAFGADVGYGAVVCTGGPLPGAAVTVTFAGLATGPITLLTKSDAFTGGTSPAASFTRVTWGNNSPVYEVDVLAFTGPPSSGSAVLSFSWNGNVYTTGTIAWNASAATVQTAILAATRSGGTAFSTDAGAGAVVCTGGPLPGTAVTITFAGLATGPITMQTSTDTFPSGSGVSFTRSTWGSLGVGKPIFTPYGPNGPGDDSLATFDWGTNEIHAHGSVFRIGNNFSYTVTAGQVVHCDTSSPNRIGVNTTRIPLGVVIESALAGSASTLTARRPLVQVGGDSYVPVTCTGAVTTVGDWIAADIDTPANIHIPGRVVDAGAGNTVPSNPLVFAYALGTTTASGQTLTIRHLKRFA